MARKSNSPSVVYGKHRSLKLAKRHLRELGPRWRITARHNAAGELSAHGHYFTFKKKKRKKKPPQKEYQINVRYKPASGPKVEVQISAKGPAGKSRVEVERAVEHKMDTGISPKGWDIHIVKWERYGRQFSGDDEKAWLSLKFFFHEREGAGSDEESGEEE